MAAEEEASARSEGTVTSWAITDCVIRVMKALIAEPHRRPHETACHAGTPCCSKLCLRGLKVQVGDKPVDGYRRTCVYGMR